MVAGELPSLPHLVELPDRGVGADMVGRAVGMLVDIYGEVVPSGWRISRRPGRDTSRAKDFLSWDLDAAQQQYAGAEWVKVQVCGPWTLAAMLEVPSGHRALTDPGRSTTSPPRWPRGSSRTSPRSPSGCPVPASWCRSTNPRCPPCSPETCPPQVVSAPSRPCRRSGRSMCCPGSPMRSATIRRSRTAATRPRRSGCSGPPGSTRCRWI